MLLFCKLRNGIKKTPQFLLFSMAKGGTKTIALLPIAEGSSFWSLEKRIYDGKLLNEKKTFSPSTQRIHSHLNCCTIVNWKTRKGTDTLKGSRRMGGGRIFLKSLRDTSFNKDPSNESNFISAGSILLDSTFNSCRKIFQNLQCMSFRWLPRAFKATSERVFRKSN
jgi:hypothetical protein